MALFTININQQGGNLDAAGLKIYYGTVNSLPTTSSSIQNLPYNQIIQSTTIKRNIDTTYNKHVVCVPNNILLDTIIDIGNSYENLTDKYILYNNNLTATINGTDYNYVGYVLQTGIPYSKETKHFTFLQNV